MRVSLAAGKVANWKFHSTWEQRYAFLGDSPYRDDFTHDEAQDWAARANHLWRGTLTIFTVECVEGRYIVAQDLIQ